MVKSKYSVGDQVLGIQICPPSEDKKAKSVILLLSFKGYVTL